ncbi:MAG: PIG-L deacetylase family protein [Catenulispora sp.]
MTTARLVLSPHPDDAVWSIGGCLAGWRDRGCPVTVLTVFDGAGQRTTEGWRRIADPGVRRRENEVALARLRVGGVSLGLPDAALRTGYEERDRLFGPPADGDAPLVARIAAGITASLSPGARLYAPVAAGDHVDHRLVRSAVESAPVLAARTVWYEDFPYRLSARHTTGLHPVWHRVDMGDWVVTARCYASQAAALFGSPDRLDAALRSRARRHGAAAGFAYAVRLWFPRSDELPKIPQMG